MGIASVDEKHTFLQNFGQVLSLQLTIDDCGRHTLRNERDASWKLLFVYLVISSFLNLTEFFRKQKVWVTNHQALLVDLLILWK